MSEAPEAKSRPSVKALALFEKGEEAARKSNYDYAIDMYLQALKVEPQNLKFRQALRAVERSQFENNPAKVGWMASGKAKMARPGIGLAKSRGKWVEALEHCEEVFKIHPWDLHAARDAAEAAEQLGWKALARWLLESVYQQAGDDAGYHRHLAHVYELNEIWEASIRCWEKVRQLVPTDEEAGRKIKGLTASATITRSGLDDALQKPAAGGGGGGTTAAEDRRAEMEELKRQAMSPEERVRKQIQEEPGRVGNYLELAEILKAQNKLDEAEKVLATGRKATGDDAVLVEAHADTQIARLQRAVTVFSRKARENPLDLAVKGKLEQITTTLQDYELKEFKRRVEHRSEDLNLRFQYGQRLVKAGRCDEAIAEFQHARNANSVKLRAEALFELGQCFELKNLPKLAERNYQEALKLAQQESETAQTNKLHYHLGIVAEKQGDLQAAEEHYNEVAANDYTYRDVAQRLENLNRQPDP